MTARRPELLTYPDADVLAREVAHQLVGHLADLQRDGKVPSVVLTGGTIADKLHRAVVDDPAASDVDWSAVDFWFGDERYVDSDDADRNAGQAHDAMLAHLPVSPDRVHVMPAADGPYGDDVEAAAAAYAEEVSEAIEDREDAFDVLMLGVGPDGHCASLFPGHEAVDADGVAVAVRDSPKPPPVRISLTMPVLSQATEVWFVASGEGKAEAVRGGYQGEDVHVVPAAGPTGRVRTVWFVDEAAASLLP